MKTTKTFKLGDYIIFESVKQKKTLMLYAQAKGVLFSTLDDMDMEVKDFSIRANKGLLFTKYLHEKEGNPLLVGTGIPFDKEDHKRKLTEAQFLAFCDNYKTKYK